jgi:hypothetical protein
VKVRALFPLMVALLAMGLAAIVYAQIEGGDRGIAAVDTSNSYEVGGITVDVVAKNAEEARLGGWKLAQRKGWQALWAKTHGGARGPMLSDSQLNGIVAGIVVDDEQIGPNRYVARLGVLFDRARTGEILGVSGNVSRSAPMLVIPVQWSGGGPISFEAKSDWQKAWARFRAGASPIDYVRVSGSGADALLLTYGQTQRPGRRWWRALLDQYGAADSLTPHVRLERQWPGGPVKGYFSARFGPDNREISSFTLRVPSSDGLPAMLDEAVRRMDQAYASALGMGLLRPDSSLIVEQPVDQDDLGNAMASTPGDLDDANTDATTTISSAEAQTFNIQFDTPDVSSVGATESVVRGAPGVQSVSTTSLALGGVSVMRVTFNGSAASLRSALAARGLRVEEGGGTVRIRSSGSSTGAAVPVERPSTSENSPDQ